MVWVSTDKQGRGYTMSILAARIKAKNRANIKAAEIQPQLRAIAESLIGENITKKDGSLLKKYQNTFPAFRDGDVRVTMSLSRYSLLFETYASENIEGMAASTSERATLYVAHMNNGVVERLYDETAFRTDYTVEEIQEKRRLYQEAERAKDKALSALDVFGTYDR